MKYRNLIITLFMITSLETLAQKNTDTTIYQFKVENIKGEEFNFNSLRGKKIMIVKFRWVDLINGVTLSQG